MVDEAGGVAAEASGAIGAVVDVVVPDVPVWLDESTGLVGLLVSGWGAVVDWPPAGVVCAMSGVASIAAAARRAIFIV
jgi:hypothetical protein